MSFIFFIADPWKLFLQVLYLISLAQPLIKFFNKPYLMCKCGRISSDLTRGKLWTFFAHRKQQYFVYSVWKPCNSSITWFSNVHYKYFITAFFILNLCQNYLYNISIINKFEWLGISIVNRGQKFFTLYCYVASQEQAINL